MSSPCRLVVLISGQGSNLQAIIDATQAADFPAEVVAVISNKAEAYGLQRAAAAGIPTQVVAHGNYADRAAYDQALMQAIDGFQPDLVVLAGFMRILSDAFVHHYTQRLLNIHPSLLPRHKGLNTHQRALAAGDKQHGATVHFVTPSLDAGPIILQAAIDVHAEDTPASLAERVHLLEHRLYPQAIRWFAEGRLRLRGDTVYLDDAPIDHRE
ncbi:MAG: phosphoribosylglycinamide formyltransferase [Gammaproteobacteria bacterium]